MCVVNNAHESDVNVLSWNHHDSLIVTGGDDAALHVWSLKTIQVTQLLFLLYYIILTPDYSHRNYYGHHSYNEKLIVIIVMIIVVQSGQPVARFKQHTGPITSVEWHPTDTTTFIATGTLIDNSSFPDEF